MSTEINLVWGGGPLYRKPGTSHAHFTTHWLAHANLAVPLFQNHGVVEYCQIHLPEILPGHLTEEEKDVLKSVDGVGVVYMDAKKLMEEGLESQYYYEIILPDERRFLHEECGSKPVMKDPPAFNPPGMSVREWRDLAMRAGAEEHCIMKDGKALREDIPQDVWNAWKTMK